MLIGNTNLKNIVLPSSIDAQALVNMTLTDNVSYADILTDISQALVVASDEVFGNAELGSMIHVTERSFVEYRHGSSGGFEDHTEFGEADATRGEFGGHMLPIKRQDRKLGWSQDYLEKARLFQVEADIANAISDFKDIIPKRIITRFFKMEKETGANLGLGATGVSVPFCDAGGSGVDYTPPRGRDGKTFASSHNHYLRLDGITQANVETAVEHLWEHGHDGPYVLRASQADAAAWVNKANVTGFVARGSALVNYGSGSDLALVGDNYIGVIVTKYGDVLVMLNSRIPTTYWGVHKVYGQDDPRNSLWYRINNKRGKSPYLLVPAAKILPVEEAIVAYDGGVAIGEDRTNGVLVKNAASSTYTTPTIS